MKTQHTSRLGFTLIELLVVVLIIGILSSIALPQYTKVVEKARAAEALVNLKTLTDQTNLFYLEKGHYPTTPGTLYSSYDNLNTLGFSVDIQPWKYGYYYYNSSSPAEVVVGSYEFKKNFTLYNYLSGGKVSRSCCSGTGCVYFPDWSAC